MPPADRPTAHLEQWPIRIRELDLLRRQSLTPRMLRITLGGPQHVGFESHIADEHVKLLFPDPPTDHSRIPTPNGDKLNWPRPIVTSRDYTVRRYDPTLGEVDIDVVVHDGGVGSTWAATAPIGSTIWVAGPPRGIRIPDEFTWQAYLGDETALPAIARRLAELPPETQGVALIEVMDHTEQQVLEAPEGIEISWLSRQGRPAGTTTILADAAARLQIPQGGGAYVWFGGESSTIKPLRALIKQAGLGRGEYDLTGYWKRGAHGNQLTAEQVMHAVKHLLHLPH